MQTTAVPDPASRKYGSSGGIATAAMPDVRNLSWNTNSRGSFITSVKPPETPPGENHCRGPDHTRVDRRCGPCKMCSSGGSAFACDIHSLFQVRAAFTAMQQPLPSSVVGFDSDQRFPDGHNPRCPTNVGCGYS